MGPSRSYRAGKEERRGSDEAVADAKAAASARPSTPSLAKMWVRWVVTVRGLMERSWAISGSTGRPPPVAAPRLPAPRAGALWSTGDGDVASDANSASTRASIGAAPKVDRWRGPPPAIGSPPRPFPRRRGVRPAPTESVPARRARRRRRPARAPAGGATPPRPSARRRSQARRGTGGPPAAAAAGAARSPPPTLRPPSAGRGRGRRRPGGSAPRGAGLRAPPDGAAPGQPAVERRQPGRCRRQVAVVQGQVGAKAK